MLLRQLEIWNYRGIKQATLEFGPHTLLVGPNNVGKSTVLQAVNCLFGREGTRPTDMDIYDFYGADVLASRALNGTMSGASEIPDGQSAASSPPDPRFRPGFIHIEGLVTLSNAEVKSLSHLDGPVIRYYTEGQEVDDPEPRYEPCCRVAFRARLKTDVEIEDGLDDSPFIVKRYFPRPLDHDSGEPLDLSPDEVRAPFLNRVGFYFLPSSRHWQTALHLDRSIMGRLLRHQGVFPVLDSWEKLSASVLGHTAKVEQESLPFKELLGRVRDRLAQLVGLPGDLGYELSDLSFRGLEQALVPFLKRSAARPLPLRHEGSGLISLQLFALILEFIRSRQDKGMSSLLVIEEPELHLFPFSQRRLLEMAMRPLPPTGAQDTPGTGVEPPEQPTATQGPGNSPQLLVTSHSPAVAGQFDLSSTLVLSKSQDGILSATPLRRAERRPEKWFRREKTAIVSALMSRAVLVVEGHGEERLLNILGCSNLHTADLAALGVAVLYGEGGQICNRAEWIANTGMSVIALVDGDSTGQNYAEDLRNRGIPYLAWPAGWKLGHSVLHNATDDLVRELWEEACQAGVSKRSMPSNLPDRADGFDELMKVQPAADAVAWLLAEKPWLPPAFSVLSNALREKLENLAPSGRLDFFEETLAIEGA